MDIGLPEEKIQAVIQCLSSTIHQGVSVIDKNLKVIMVNETARRLLEIPDAVKTEGESLASLFRYNAERGEYGPGDPERQVEERLALARKFEAHDFIRERPDGRILRIQGTPMADGGFVTTYTDVTAEHRQEKELREARERLEGSLNERNRQLKTSCDLLLSTVNAISDGVGVADCKGRLILANHRMRDLFPNLDSLILHGGHISEAIQLVFPDEPFRELEEFAGPNMWTERQFPDDRWYKVSRTRTDDGGLIAVYSDITEFKRQHAVLQQHADELVRHLREEKRFSEMQREFVSMASHEFRTPLAIIDSNAQRIQRKIGEFNSEAVLERVGRIRDAVDRMQYLINRFLDFSQSQAVGMEIQKDRVDLRSLLETVCERQSSVSKKHRINLDIGDLPEYAEVDRKLIEQCLSNLLSNAVKYSPGKQDVHVRGAAEGNHAVISIRDEGVGIPEAELPKIFNRYFRASTSSGIAGTGIGLNLTEMVVQKHRGKIDVESQVGRGTTITMRLPITPPKPRRTRTSKRPVETAPN